MTILNITEILPAPIKEKSEENDVLIVTAQKHIELYPDSRHIFILIVPFVSYFTSLFSKKWKYYFLLQKNKQYELATNTITVVALPIRGMRFPFLRPLLNFIGYVLNKRKLLQLSKKGYIDIIHAHNVHNAAYIAQKLADELSIPFVVTTRKIQSFQGNASVRKILESAAALIHINHIQQTIVNSLKINTPSFLIPHGVEDFFLNYKRPAFQPKNAVVKIVSVCRLVKLKNIDKVLLALEECNLDFIYDIYGEGPDLDRLNQLKSTLRVKDKVRFMGTIEHTKVPEVLSLYDLFVMPSYPETFGRAYLEAMSMGLPVIASKNTGIDGYIVNNKSGFLVNHENIHELSLLLSRLIVDSEMRKKIGKSGRSIAAQFSWDRVIDKLHRAYSLALKSDF